MTRTELREEIAGALGIPRREATLVLEAILDGMVAALKKGERIEIRGFGSFSTYHRASRNGRNPATGTQFAVPERTVPHFTPAAALKTLLSISGRGELDDAGDHPADNGAGQE